MNQALNGLKHIETIPNFSKGNLSTAKMAHGFGMLTTRAVCRHPCKCKRQRPPRVSFAAFFSSWTSVKQIEKIQWNKDEQSAWQLSVTFPSCFRDWIPGNSPLAQLIPLAPGDSLLHATRQWDDLFSLVLREMGKKSYGDFHQWGYTPIAGLFLYVFVRENPI